MDWVNTCLWVAVVWITEPFFFLSNMHSSFMYKHSKATKCIWIIDNSLPLPFLIMYNLAFSNSCMRNMIIVELKFTTFLWTANLPWILYFTQNFNITCLNHIFHNIWCVFYTRLHVCPVERQIDNRRQENEMNNIFCSSENIVHYQSRSHCFRCKNVNLILVSLSLAFISCLLSTVSFIKNGKKPKTKMTKNNELQFCGILPVKKDFLFHIVCRHLFFCADFEWSGLEILAFISTCHLWESFHWQTLKLLVNHRNIVFFFNCFIFVCFFTSAVVQTTQKGSLFVSCPLWRTATWESVFSRLDYIGLSRISSFDVASASDCSWLKDWEILRIYGSHWKPVYEFSCHILFSLHLINTYSSGHLIWLHAVNIPNY